MAIKKYKEFISKYSHKVKQNISLARHCTFKVGGVTDLFVNVKNSLELMDAVKLAYDLNIPYFLLAGGSNIVFSDKGFRGLVIHFIANDIEVDKKKMVASVEAGCTLNRLVRYLAGYNLGGMNFLANIPGSVGGAIIGNAGCYGREIADVLVDVDIFDVKKSKVLRVKSKNLSFSYRESKLKQLSHWIVLSARLRLVKDKQSHILKDIEQEKKMRLKKHPVASSAGSFFKNPKRQPVWRFIDAAGMRGVTLDGARVSNKHPNFIINYRRATAKDVCQLAALVRKAVKAKIGILLESEVRFVDQHGKISSI